MATQTAPVSQTDKDKREAQDAKAAADAAKELLQLAEAKAQYWLIKAPLAAAGLGASMPVTTLNVHPQINREGNRIEGGAIRLIDGVGHTTNPDHARFVAEYWGPDGFQVASIDATKLDLPEDVITRLLSGAPVLL